MNVEPLTEKYACFGWERSGMWTVTTCKQVVDALESARNAHGKPIVILAETVKGKGVSFMEDIAGWHGKTPSYDETVKRAGGIEL